MARTERTYVAGPDDAGRRLDRLLRRLLPDLGLSAIYKLLRSGGIRLDGAKASPAALVQSGAKITLRLPSPEQGPKSGGRPDNGAGASAFALAGMVLAETADIVVVNKPRGMLTHGPGGLDELCRSHFRDRMASSLAFRPAPLHRLDRNTSGAVAVSASIKGARAFSSSLRAGELVKEYLAVLDGCLSEPARWEDELARDEDRRATVESERGRRAVTLVTPLASSGGRTLVRLRLVTGLTHQIRAQAAIHGHPLSGDAKYGGSARGGGYLLHCVLLSCPAWPDADSPGTVLAPLPPNAQALIRDMFGPAAAKACEGACTPESPLNEQKSDDICLD